MEIILLGIYSFFVWLIFIKFKLLPWTTPWKVAVAITPVVALATMLLVLNIVAPTTTDVRVVKYIVPIVSQVKGRVIEVPVENNRPVKKGDVLFRIDPTPYEAEVRALEAQLASEEAKVGAEQAKVGETQARLPDAASTERQLNEELKEATSRVTALEASLELARKRVAQNTELAATGAGNRFDLEQAQTTASELANQIAAGRAAQQQIREKLSGRVGKEFAAVAGVKSQITTAQAQVQASRAQVEMIRAQLENARWNLAQTIVRAPADGTMVNVMLRPGYFVSGVAFNEVMTFVDSRVPGLRNVQPERTAPGRARTRSRDHPRYVPGPHRQGACRLGDLGAVAGGDRSVRRSASDDLHLTSGQVSGEARGRRARQCPLPGGGRPRRGRDLYGTRRAHSPHSKSADQDVVVSRLHHHQAPYQSPLKDGTNGGSPADCPALASCDYCSARDRTGRGDDDRWVRAEDARLMQLRSRNRRCRRCRYRRQWTAAGAGAGAPADNWLASFNDEQLAAAVIEAIVYNADLRVGAARVEQAQLYAKLAGAKLYPSVDLLARGGGKLSGDGSGIQGSVLTATWEIDLWGRVRYGRAASAAQAASAQADFEYARQSIAALVAKSWFLATEAGLQVEAARETVRGSEELVPAGR